MVPLFYLWILFFLCDVKWNVWHHFHRQLVWPRPYLYVGTVRKWPLWLLKLGNPHVQAFNRSCPICAVAPEDVLWGCVLLSMPQHLHARLWLLSWCHTGLALISPSWQIMIGLLRHVGRLYSSFVADFLERQSIIFSWLVSRLVFFIKDPAE